MGANEKSKHKIIIAVVIIAVLAAAGAVLLLSNSSSQLSEDSYNNAVGYYKDGKYEEAIAAFTDLNGYKDSDWQIRRCRLAIKDSEYNDILTLIDNGRIVEAYEKLIAMNGYRDSRAIAEDIYDQYKAEKLKAAVVGDTVVFGAYEQDNNADDGKEEIEWIVLERQDDRLFLISRYCLDYKPFDAKERLEYAMTWELSDIREWMNSVFLSAAFSADEQDKILGTKVIAEKNPNYDEMLQNVAYGEKNAMYKFFLNVGNDTIDKIFFLSISEAEKYFPSEESRKCSLTDFARSQTMLLKEYKEYSWYLRTSGTNAQTFVYIDGEGRIELDGASFYHSGVRPAMWISVDV